MTKLADMESKTRILVQGGTGSGKTHMIGTLCNMLPTLVVTGDAEGLDTLRHMVAPETEVELIEDWSQMVTQRRRILDLARTKAALAIDDVGSILDVFKHYIERRPWNWKEERTNQASLAEIIDKELALGERRFDMQRWGQLSIGLDSFFSEMFRNGPAIQLYTVHDAPRDDPFSQEEVLVPNLQGAIRLSLQARCSLIVHVYKETQGEKTVYRASTKPHQRVSSKDRFSDAGETWDNPSMATLLQYITGRRQLK